MTAQAPESHTTDFLILGSGAGGATAAMTLAEAGARVTVLEEGSWLRTKDFPADLLGAFGSLWRDFGYQTARGRALTPVLEGRCVGGSTVISGAILHPFPQAVWQEWEASDPGMARRISWASIEAATATIAQRLGASAKLEPLLTALPAHAALTARGHAVGAMTRAAPGCRHTGRCLTGCPTGGKASMEQSFIPRAVELGAVIVPDCRVGRILFEGRRATAVEARLSAPDGGPSRRCVFHARRAVLVACGTVRSPLLLAASDVRLPALGQFFQAHVGSSVVGLFDRPVSEIEGPAMGLEIFDPQGFKLATQTVPPELLFGRLPVVGARAAELARGRERLSAWTSMIRSTAKGAVRRSLSGGAAIRFDVTQDDLLKIRQAALRMAEILFDLGARTVFPQITGIAPELAGHGACSEIGAAPLDARAYPVALTHLFGTCRMGTRPADSVTGPDFAVHGRDALYVVDASVFPTNLGVNPQLSIMALARVAAERILEQHPG